MPSTELCNRLAEMEARQSGGLVQKLPRQAGQKEARWAQRLTGEPFQSHGDEPVPLTVSLALPPEVDRRLAVLETEVVQLRAELVKLRQALGES